MPKREDNPRKMNLYLSEQCRTQLEELARADRAAGDSGASPSSVVQKLVMTAHRRQFAAAGRKFLAIPKSVINGKGKR